MNTGDETIEEYNMSTISFSGSAMIQNVPAILEGQDVWIVGSDPTLDGYPDDFLKDKTAMTLHLAHLKFPSATIRYTSEYDRSEKLLATRDDYHNGLIVSSLPHYGKTKKQTKDLLQDCASVIYHEKVNYLPTGVREEVSQSFTNWKVARTIDRKSHVWGGHGSCLHTCIFAALYLGAAAIHVIGSGHSLVSGEAADHFAAADGIHQNMRVGDTFTDAKIAYPVIMQTIALKKACEQNGVPFYWHERYTPEMDRYITVPDQFLDEMRIKARRTFPLYRRLYRFCIKRPITLLFHSWR